MKNINYKKLLIPNIPYVFIALFATKLGQAARLAPGFDFSSKVLNIMQGFSMAFENIMPSFHPVDLLVGIAAAVFLKLAVYIKGKNAKKFRKNLEYGSARWGTREDIAPFIDPVFENNVILTQTESLMMSNRPKDPKNARNKNVLVVGGSGSGKTRFFIKPQLLQAHSSYVVTDPKGGLVNETGAFLMRKNYRLKIFNTINFKKSMHYNPFAYIHSEKDILKLVTTLISNTKGDGKSGDEFWTKAETLLYTALIGYIHYEAPPEEQNFATLLEFINAMEVREDDEEYKTPLTVCLRNWQNETQITLPCVNMPNILLRRAKLLSRFWCPAVLVWLPLILRSFVKSQCMTNWSLIPSEIKSTSIPMTPRISVIARRLCSSL